MSHGDLVCHPGSWSQHSLCTAGDGLPSIAQGGWRCLCTPAAPGCSHLVRRLSLAPPSWALHSALAPGLWSDIPRQRALQGAWTAAPGIAGRAEMEQAQRNLDAEQMQQQQLKLRDRQKFFEEVFQHDVDFFFPMSHLQIEHRRPPLGSISSMEVNVDMLEQMDVLDLSDQDTVDVFLGCGTEESSIAGSLPGADASQCPEEITLQVPNAAESKSRISSTSSASTDLNSLDTSEEGAETPVVQSDEEELQEDSPKEQVVRS
ncbi:dysbindin domain-containing protein 2 isoform X3 [Zonotrichia leucophrys gambelii]|uniref:dysbindin domain-containing protein 2 isoform X3 n=1 Tax=Zonotrichia leucophrys gambelii TaxID=257770 RepID=UPI0031409181